MSASSVSRRGRLLGLMSLVVVACGGGETAQVPEPIDFPPAPASYEGMTLVPAGEFKMGSDASDNWADRDEFPQRIVQLPAFYIDEVEVSNIEYKHFVDATNYPPPSRWKDGNYLEGTEFLPVTNVTWWDACAYAKWAGKRLPTEPEWEKAARGSDGRRFPWGNDFSPEYANDGSGPMPIGSYPKGASPYGARDMAGNVAEWTASVYVPYSEIEAVLPADFGGRAPAASGAHSTAMPPTATSQAPPVDPNDKKVKVKFDDPRLRFFPADMLQDVRPRVYRGGSFNSYARFLRTVQRQKEDPGARWENVGFRCAANAGASAPATTPAPAPAPGAGDAR